MTEPYRPEGDGCVPALPGYEQLRRSRRASVAYDYKTPDYEIYVAVQLAYTAGRVSQEARDTALARAQKSAARYDTRRVVLRENRQKFLDDYAADTVFWLGN